MREKPGKLECLKNIKEKQRFQRRPRLAAKRAYCFILTSLENNRSAVFEATTHFAFIPGGQVCSIGR